MSIESIITEIATLQMEIEGIRQAHDDPPSSINTIPCFVNFIGPAEVNYTPSRRETRHTIQMQLYITKQVLPQSEKLLRPFVDKVLDYFDQNMQLNSTCAYSMITAYDPGVLTYNNTDYLGIIFNLLAVELEGRTFNV